MPDSMAGELRDEPLSPAITRSDLVFEGAVWDIRSDRFAYGDSEIVRQYTDHPGAVVIIAIDDADQVLLIQQYRHPIRHRDWELPAGLLDVEGEAPMLAAQRELAEEADLLAETWEPLLSTYSSPGGSNEEIHFFLATGLSAATTAHAREDEEADIRVEWVPLNEAVTAILEGRMRNALLGLGLLATVQRRQRA